MPGASAKRYAQVVFQIAQEQNSADKWQTDLRAIADVAARRDLVVLLRNPRIPEDAKHRVLREALPGAGDQAVNLATLLVLHGGFESLAAQVADGYDKLLDESRGIIRAKVTTATPVDQAEQQRITDRLSAATGKTVKTELHVDPAIIGGMVVRLGDRLVDGSVRSQLQGLRRSLAQGAKI